MITATYDARRDAVTVCDGRALMVVHYDGTAAHERPSSITVSRDSGWTPTDLSRFPWRAWLVVADAERRYAMAPTPAAPGATLSPPPRGRPRGPEGHGQPFYEQIAEEYRQARRRGLAPTRAVADARGVNRNTVAGWIRRCRERGLLPPARSGIAG